MEGKKNSVMYDDFVVINAVGARVTGLVNGDFTRSLYNPSNTEVSGAITVTITELGGGSYRASYTPNASGLWKLDIFQATYFPEGKTADHQIYDANIDTVVIGTPIFPNSIDLAATAAVYFGVSLKTNRGTVPATSEITPGTFYIHRKAKRATSWTTMRNGVALEKIAGYARYGEIFSAAAGYAEGDSIRIGFAGVSVTIGGVTTEIYPATPGAYYHTYIRETGVKEMYTSGVTVSDKTGFSLLATGADLILKSSTFVQAVVEAVNEFATYGLTALNTLLVTTGIKAASIPAATLADDAITASKFDETTAYPIKSDDSGSTKIARTGADSDTLETLSDQIDSITTDVTFLKDIEGGKWKIEANQMIFCKSDNLTEIARFNLKDSSGNPAMTNVFQRERV